MHGYLFFRKRGMARLQAVQYYPRSKSYSSSRCMVAREVCLGMCVPTDELERAKQKVHSGPQSPPAPRGQGYGGSS